MILLVLAGCWGTPLAPVSPPTDAATVLERAERAPADPLVGRWHIELPEGDAGTLAAVARGEAPTPDAAAAAARWIAAHPDDARADAFRAAAARVAGLELEVGASTWTVHDGAVTTTRTWTVNEVISTDPARVLALELARDDGAVERVTATWREDESVEVRRRVGQGEDAVVLRPATPSR